MKSRASCCVPDKFPTSGNSEDDLGLICKAMGHPARVRIVRILLEKGSCISGDLADSIDLAPSTVSEHLRILKESALIQGTIDGPRRCYCVNQATLKYWRRLLRELNPDRQKKMTLAHDRIRLITKAFRLEWFTIAWMIAEAVVAVWSGVTARSVSLIAFGFDSVIELLSAGVLIWRLNVELRYGHKFSEAAERRAGKVAGGLLLVLAFYVVIAACWSLWKRDGEEFSPPGLILTIIAIPTMYFLAKAKLRVADALGSRAIRADAVETITCGYLSFVVVIGLIADYFLRAWWVDSVTSLAIVYFLVKEGREAWSDKDCCACSGKKEVGCKQGGVESE